MIKNTAIKQKKSKNEMVSSVSAYNSFQKHLEDRPELRSSVVPMEIEVSEIKTPLKPVRRRVLAVSTPLCAPNSISLRSSSKNQQILSTPN